MNGIEDDNQCQRYDIQFQEKPPRDSAAPRPRRPALTAAQRERLQDVLNQAF
jgi:hypothetical protein